jgi:hypothetical protein
VIKPVFQYIGGNGENRTLMDFSTCTSSMRVYQFRHVPKICFQKITNNYFFVLASFLGSTFAVFAGLTAVFETFAAGAFDETFETFVIGGMVTGELAAEFEFAAFASTFAFVSVVAGVSVVVSGLLDKTEILPFKAGIANISADSIKTVAAMIVVFDKTVAVPREPNALLETLLVNNAPASDLPG